jgi:catechol 2,3-dioxygenase-like lactoylglutathione lyase family enzyme
MELEQARIVDGVDHFNVRTRELAGTVRFYDEVLGLRPGPRPGFPFPGAWLYNGSKRIVHLVDIAQTQETQVHGCGAVDHIAFAAVGCDAMMRRLASLQVAHEVRRNGTGDAVRIFVSDPNGIVIELNFGSEGEATAAGTAATVSGLPARSR